VCLGGPSGVVEQAEELETRFSEVGGREDRALGIEVAKPGAGPVAGKRLVPCGGADLVGPLPSDLDGMVGAVARAQKKRGRGDLRRGEGSVRGHHRGDVAQRGTELFGEALHLACWDLQPLIAQDHPPQRRRGVLDETHESQPPALGFVAGLVVAALGAHNAVSAGTQKQQRLQAVRLFSVDLEHRIQERSLIVLLRDVDNQHAPLLASHLAEPSLRVHKLKSEAGRLAQNRPKLHAVAVTEIKRLLGSVAVVGGSSLAGTVDGIQLAN